MTQYAVDKVAQPMDGKLGLLVHIKDVNPAFYNEFVREFLTDRLTLTNLERDLVRALSAIAGITVYVTVDDLSTVWVKYKSVHREWDEPHDSYESALRFAVGLLHVKWV
jgi:hypothetical protein